jgi:hypothetical protein
VYGLGRAKYKGQNKEKDYHESTKRRKHEKNREEISLDTHP